MKKCTRCQKVLPMNSFGPDKRNKDGKKGACRICLNAYYHQYKMANPERCKKRMRKYDRSPKGVYKQLKSTRRKHKVLISQEAFVKWYKAQPKECVYCGLKVEMLNVVSDVLNNKNSARLSIDRIDSSKGYEEGNMVLACSRCNLIKGDFFTRSEMEEIGRTYVSKKWMEQYGH